MPLPDDFIFSQQSLQDYADCPRRFYLRYVRQLAWPAIESEPVLENEHLMQQGAAFHRLLHRHAIGIPAGQLENLVEAEELTLWWKNYREWGPADLPAERYPETILSAPLAGFRLMARYDLIAVDPGRRCVIVDWKTSQKRPRRSWLAERQQSRVYPYLWILAGSQLNGSQAPQPEQVEMVYWFANAPTEPERFQYSAQRCRADGEYLAALIATIDRLEPAGFILTPDAGRCRFCTYRSLCDRGVEAGRIDEPGFDEVELPEEEGNLIIDLDQIAEIEY